MHSSYSTTSLLFWGDKVLESSEGVQQGDPLGPLLFCLSIHSLTSQLVSDFKVFYLDDGTLGGSCADALQDLTMVEEVADELGLKLNRSKSEVVCHDSSTLESFLLKFPGFQITSPEKVTLLGSPLTENVDITILEKVRVLRVLGDRIHHFQVQDAILLLRYSLAAPKLLYLLRCSPCFQSPHLQLFDDVLRGILSTVCNIPIALCDSLWKQASLPVRCGGLGVRSVVHLAPSAFLSSVAGSRDLVNQILPSRIHSRPYPEMDAALSAWLKWHTHPPLTPPESFSQKKWDAPVVQELSRSLLENAADERTKARLLASMCKESGAWLNAFPISSCGLRMDNETTRVAIGLRLGAPLCQPHQCRHCGSAVDALATHGLSCRWSEGRLPRHAAINDIIHRSLTSAKVPSRLEPNGLFRSDGKRPDGLSLVPWKEGKPLIWDATCPDTFAASHVRSASKTSGTVAEQAEEGKCSKYSRLRSSYHFVPVGIETSGVFGPQAAAFLHDLGRRLKTATLEHEALNHLLQRISVAVQRTNYVAIKGTLPIDNEDLNCILF